MNCQEIRGLLAEEPEAAGRDAAVKEHLAKCAACRSFYERLISVEKAFSDLSEIKPPDEIVSATVKAVKKPRRGKKQKGFRLAMAAVPVVLLLVIGAGVMTLSGIGMQAEEAPEAAARVSGLAQAQDKAEENQPMYYHKNLRGMGSSGKSPYGGDSTRNLEKPSPPAKKPAPKPEEKIPALVDEPVLSPGPADEGGKDDDTWDRVYKPPEGGRTTIETLLTGERVKALKKKRERTMQVIRGPVAADIGIEEEEDEDGTTFGASELTKREQPIEERGLDLSLEHENRLSGKEGLEDVPETYGWEEGEAQKRSLADGEYGKKGKERKEPSSPGKISGNAKLARQSRLVPVVRDGKAQGVKVFAVKPDSDMAKAGILNGDVITSIDGVSLSSPDKALQGYARTSEKDKITLDVERGGERLRLNVPATGSAGKRGETEKNRTRGKDADAKGFLVIQSAPSMSRVYVDGRQVERSSLAPVPVHAGQHRVKIERRGYEPHETTVTIKPGELTEISLDPDEVALDELDFISARGYFANTYLPGDPDLEWLERRLQQDLRLGGERLDIQRMSTPYRQPFDAPRSSGMDVFLSADRTAVEGPARVTLQVGLKGSVRHAGRRAPLNAAIVFDMRSVPSEEHRRIFWKIADNMAANQQAGDRFNLVVAGVDDPLCLEPGKFDLVQVRRELARALSTVEESGARGNLDKALEVAYRAIGGKETDASPLGANLVVLVSGSSLSGELENLLRRAHTEALLGIQLTAIGVGSQADMSGLSKLALAGQGRRRIITDAKQVRGVIEDELAASGRVVARALRLRIRLARDVKLVEVLGSQPLSAERSQKEREVEQAIDKRVARTLGIEADRGEDEEGIQIIIPAFYAGDEHVILLDVVVSGPGKLADVRLRYKDLVGMQNAVASASLDLPAGKARIDPLAINVRKNLLAYRMSRDLQEAAAKLNDGEFSRAKALVARASGRLQSLQKRFASLAADPELKRDAAMLQGYRGVLGSYPSWQSSPGIRDYLIHSLAYAGRVKLPPGAPR